MQPATASTSATPNAPVPEQNPPSATAPGQQQAQAPAAASAPWHEIKTVPMPVPSLYSTLANFHRVIQEDHTATEVAELLLNTPYAARDITWGSEVYRLFLGCVQHNSTWAQHKETFAKLLKCDLDSPLLGLLQLMHLEITAVYKYSRSTHRQTTLDCSPCSDCGLLPAAWSARWWLARELADNEGNMDCFEWGSAVEDMFVFIQHTLSLNTGWHSSSQDRWVAGMGYSCVTGIVMQEKDGDGEPLASLLTVPAPLLPKQFLGYAPSASPGFTLLNHDGKNGSLQLGYNMFDREDTTQLRCRGTTCETRAVFQGSDIPEHLDVHTLKQQLRESQRESRGNLREASPERRVPSRSRSSRLPGRSNGGEDEAAELDPRVDHSQPAYTTPARANKKGANALAEKDQTIADLQNEIAALRAQQQAAPAPEVQPVSKPPPVGPSLHMPLFREFDGTSIGEAAQEWLTHVQRYWQFSLAGHKGSEVTFTLCRLKGDASNWYTSELGPLYGSDGAGCPKEVFVEKFTERYILPEARRHAAKRFTNLKQGDTEIRTFNDKFNRSLLMLKDTPGGSFSPAEESNKYLFAIAQSTRNGISRIHPDMQLQSLSVLQAAAVLVADAKESLDYFNKPAAATFTEGAKESKSNRSIKLTRDKGKGRPRDNKQGVSQASGNQFQFASQYPSQQQGQARQQGHSHKVGNPQRTSQQYDPDLQIPQQDWNRQSTAFQSDFRNKRKQYQSSQSPDVKSRTGGALHAMKLQATSGGGTRGNAQADHYQHQQAGPSTPDFQSHGFTFGPARGVSPYPACHAQTVEAPPVTAVPMAPAAPDVMLSAAAHSGDQQSSLTMLFSVTTERRELSGPRARKRKTVKLKCLIDTGSTHSFLSEKYSSCVQPNGAVGLVKLADSATSVQCKFGKASLKLGNCKFSQTVGTMPLNPAFDLILGDDWLKSFKAVIHYDRLSPTTDDRGIRFENPADSKVHHVPLSTHFSRAEMNSVIWNTVASVQSSHLNGTSDVDRMFMLEITPAMAEPDYMAAAAVSEHDNSLPHSMQADYDSDREQFDSPDAEVQVEAQSMKGDVEDLCKEYKDRFPSDIPAGLPPFRQGVVHLIPLKAGDQNPPARKFYRLSPAEKVEVEAKVAELLEKGWIQPSHSPYGSRVLFVGKKDGGLRMCVDYRPLNDQTVKNKYPIPRIDDLLDHLHGAQYFTSLDLQQAYHQVRLLESDIPKTAFLTHQGLYEYRVLCFGLSNAPATFQALMNSVLRPLIGKCCLVYMDDVLVYSRTPEEHLQHLRSVLQCLRENQLYCKLSKCKFGLSETKFCGHIVTRQGIKPNPVKVQVLQDWPAPDSKDALRAFLGLAQYFAKFIPAYASMTTCLQVLMRKSANWHWSDACQQAFENVKQAMLHEPCLAIPNADLPFEVVTDACSTGIGAVLLQEGRPVAFTGRQLTDAETRYHTTDQELLAVIFALQQWRCYLQGASHPFLLVTDHHPNAYLKTQPNLSRRQTRWSERLQEYNFEWQYRPGKHNVADAVSRQPNLPKQLQANAVSMHFDWIRRPAALHPGLASALVGHSEQLSACLHAAVKVSQPQIILAALTRSAAKQGEQGTQPTPKGTGKPPKSAFDRPSPAVYGEHDSIRLSWQPELQQAYKEDPMCGDPLDLTLQHKHITARHGLWYKDRRIVVPHSPSIKRQILTELHDSKYAGHGGEYRTTDLVKRYFWWPQMDTDCRQFVKGCSLCQRNKAHTRRYAGLLQQHDMPTQKWQQVSMDFIQGLPVTARGNDMIMTVVDTLSKQAHFVPCKAAMNAEGTARLYCQEIFKHHGWPRVIISDRDTRFKDDFFRALCTQLQTRQQMSSAYHHETNGQAERMNRVLEETLRHFVSDKMDDWDDLLPAAEFAINNSHQQSIGTTPFYLCYGYHPSVPLDVGVSPHPQASEFLHGHQSAMQAAGRFHAFAQQRLNADHISALVSEARDHMVAARNRQKQYADSHRVDLQFEQGDNVMLKTKNLNLLHWPSRKLFPLWVGPFEVAAKVNAVSYRLVMPTHWHIHDVFHVSLLKAYRDNGQDHPPSPFTYIAGQPYEYEVQQILEHWPPGVTFQQGMPHKVLKEMQFLVRWKFATSEQDSWEPYQNLQHAPESLVAYERSLHSTQ